MTARRDLMRLVHATERDLERLMAHLPAEAERIVLRHARDGRIDAASIPLIQRDLAAMLDGILPRTSREPSAFEALLRRSLLTAWRLPVQAVTRAARQRLPNEVLEAFDD